MNSEYRPKIQFEVTEEQKVRADKLIGDYGLRKGLFQPILDDLLDLVEEKGGIAIGILLSKKLRPRDVLPTLNKIERSKEDG